MKLIKAKDRNLQLIDKLLEVWESSVRATHNFLSNEEILEIKKICTRSIKWYISFNY